MKHKRQPDPERLRVKLRNLEITEASGGYVYKALAQVYDQVNDRGMIFRFGSGSKTIQERIPKGRVKIHDGHPWNPSSQSVVGKVTMAEERSDLGGVVYTGFLSSAEGELATKMAEGVMDENSLEVLVARERPLQVPLDDVPEQTRMWIPITPAGDAEVREILEWIWLAIGIVGSSSQGVPAIIDSPQVVPFQDLPIAAASRAFEADGAQERVLHWATVKGEVNHALLSRAYLARASSKRPGPFVGQIADVVDGQLVVIPDALASAWQELEELSDDPVTRLAMARAIGRYEAKLGEESLTVAASSPHSMNETHGGSRTPALSPPARTLAAKPDSAAPGIAPPSEEAGGTEGLDAITHRESVIRELQMELAILDVAGPGLPGREKPHVAASAGEESP